MERRFAAELQSRVIEPWHRKCWAWVRRLEHAPSEKALTGAIRANCMPNQVALAEILRKYILDAADAGGQAAVDKSGPVILKALRASGIDTRAQEALPVPASPPSSESAIWKAIEAEWFAAGGPGEVRKGAIPLHEDMKSTVQELLSRGEGWNATDGFTFHLRDPELQRELLRRGEKIRGQVTDTMLSDFRDLMAQQFYREGLPPDQLALEIEQLFPTTYKDRALVIANTETGIAYGVVNHEASVRNGVDGHEWRTAGSNPREAHLGANGQVRPITQPFVVGGERLMHPSDPSGSAGNIINCHCLELPVLNDARFVPAKPWTGQPARELAREIIKAMKLRPDDLLPASQRAEAIAKKTAIESSARLVSALTQDEFIANPPPGYRWNPRLLNEANRHENRGYTTVGPKLFELEPDGRYHALLHEVGHDLADEMSADRSTWKLVDNGAFNGIFGGEKRPMGINGQTIPDEMVAEAFATHLDEEAWLREHFPMVHTEIAGRLLTFFSRMASR